MAFSRRAHSYTTSRLNGRGRSGFDALSFLIDRGLLVFLGDGAFLRQRQEVEHRLGRPV